MCLLLLILALSSLNVKPEDRAWRICGMVNKALTANPQADAARNRFTAFALML
jgi:hypothetical protein